MGRGGTKLLICLWRSVWSRRGRRLLMGRCGWGLVSGLLLLGNNIVRERGRGDASFDGRIQAGLFLLMLRE
jgi:hypothetical protein